MLLLCKSATQKFCERVVTGCCTGECNLNNMCKVNKSCGGIHKMFQTEFAKVEYIKESNIVLHT